MCGAPARIRTADLPLTRRLLWPTELLGLKYGSPGWFRTTDQVINSHLLYH